MDRKAIITAHAHKVSLGAISVAIDLCGSIPSNHKGAIKDFINEWASADHGPITDMEFVPIEEIPAEALEYWPAALELINTLPYMHT